MAPVVRVWFPAPPVLFSNADPGGRRFFVLTAWIRRFRTLALCQRWYGSRYTADYDE
jgi:hypothetical protein